MLAIIARRATKWSGISDGCVATSPPLLRSIESDSRRLSTEEPRHCRGAYAGICSRKEPLGRCNCFAGAQVVRRPDAYGFRRNRGRRSEMLGLFLLLSVGWSANLHAFL